MNCRNNQGMTPLLQLLFNSASKQNVQEIVRLFVENGVDVNAKNKNNGSNALHSLLTFYDGNDLIAVVRLRIENGACKGQQWTERLPSLMY